MRERKTLRYVLLIAGILLLVICLIAGAKYKESVKQKEIQEKEAAVLQMLDITEEFVETLNNREYEAHVNLHSQDGIEYYDGIASMYSFLNRYDFGDTVKEDYSDIRFKIIEVYEDDLKRNYTLSYEEFIEEGVSLVVEFGNSEKKYRQKWAFEFIMEDGEMKIDEGIRLSNNVLWEVEAE